MTATVNDVSGYVFYFIEICNSYIPSQFYLFVEGNHVATSQTPQDDPPAVQGRTN